MIDDFRLKNLRGDFEVLMTHDIKPNFSALQRKHGIDRHTVKKYWKNGCQPRKPRPQTSKLDPYLDEIRAKAESTTANKKSLFHFFRTKYGSEIFSSYSTFSHYLQRKEINAKADHKAHVRYETPPGDQLQVDWKEDLKMVLKDGSVIKYNLFVATLGYSRFHCFVYSKTKTTEDFLRCLISVFQKIGGLPKRVVTDNMTAVVSVQNHKKTKHSVIKQFEKDTGIQIQLCKIKTPQTKGKVESANRYENRLEAYNNELESETDLLKQIEQLNKEMNLEANGTTGLPPVILLKKEMEHLLPVPNKVLIENYVKEVIVQIVPPTLLVRYKGSQYSVPPEFIGKKVKLIPAENKLYVYFNTELICIHDVSGRKTNYKAKHYISGLSAAVGDSLSDDEIVRRAMENLALFDQFEEK